jgi:beta-mannosidase
LSATFATQPAVARLSLGGEWQLSFGRQEAPAAHCDTPVVPAGFATVPAQVPGNVELDLVRAGLLPADLEHGDNIYLLLPYEDHQWWYRRHFEIDDLSRFPSAVLKLDGVDTLATIWLNGERIGAVANMLVPHELPLGAALRQGTNELIIAIDSAVLAGFDRRIDAGTWAMENNWESLFVRKAPHGYGWDIMPRVVSAGLWREVAIEARPTVRFTDVYLATLAANPATRSAEFIARWSLATRRPGPDERIILTVSDPKDGRTLHTATEPVLGPHGEFRTTIADVDLWYPRGFGSAALYDVCLAHVDASGNPIAEWHGRFGFRTVKLLRRDFDLEGEGEFVFVVNGERVFIKGSNWVPLDAFHSRDVEHLPTMFALVVDLNCNMVRCWGGSVYEDQPFFDFCDREGVMVWQDFALACAVYPQSPDFLQMMRSEAEILVPRLRNHPCLAVWAGNNEVDQLYFNSKPGTDPNVDDRISRSVLPAVCRALDPYREYLPSSPYYSPSIWERGGASEAMVEDHLWGPRDDFKGRFYTSSPALFASEIGYHGCPSRSTLERIMRPEMLWPWQDNEDWLTHAVRPQPASTRYNYRIPLMAHQIGVLFGSVPDELDDFILASQISQTEALKFFIEMFRLRKGRRTGLLWWNIRDGWPQISDAIVDFYGARKIAYEVVKRLQSDVLVMLGEPDGGLQEIVAVNETAAVVTIDVAISVRGTPLFKSPGVEVPANGRVLLGMLPAHQSFALLDITWVGSRIEGHNHYVGGPRPFDLKRLVSAYRGILGDETLDRQVRSTTAQA